jgi:hypothetical protein
MRQQERMLFIDCFLVVNFVWEVGFEVLTAVSMKIAVFWVVAPCSLVEVYQRFRGPCCLHHQGDRRLDDGGRKGSLEILANVFHIYINVMLRMRFIVSLSTAAVMEVLLHRKPAFAGNIRVHFSPAT